MIQLLFFFSIVFSFLASTIESIVEKVSVFELYFCSSFLGGFHPADHISQEQGCAAGKHNGSRKHCVFIFSAETV